MILKKNPHWGLMVIIVPIITSGLNRIGINADFIWDHLLDENDKPNSLNNIASYLVLGTTSFTFLYFSYQFMRKTMKDKDVNSFAKLKSFIKGNFLSNRLQLKIHHFQHLIENIKEEILNTPLEKRNESHLGALLYKLLHNIQTIVKIQTGHSFSFNVKIFEFEKNNEAGVDYLKHALLRTVSRMPSQHESSKTDPAFRARSNREKFIIKELRYNKDITNDNELKKFVTILNGKKTEYEESGVELKINSAYLQVFGKGRHFFMSNNLDKSEEMELFLSTSVDYKKYYKSLAVFLISPTIDSNVCIETNNSQTFKPSGMLIVDSESKNIFRREQIKDLIGYFAHRLHEIITLYGE